MKRMFLGIAALILLVLTYGLLKGSPTNPAESEQKASSDQYEVKIDNFSFGPSTLTVPVGATVTWTNQDDVPHNVTSTEGQELKSSVLDTDQKFSHTFTTAGAFSYYCSIHPKMTGKVVVE